MIEYQILHGFLLSSWTKLLPRSVEILQFESMNASILVLVLFFKPTTNSHFNPCKSVSVVFLFHKKLNFLSVSKSMLQNRLRSLDEQRAHSEPPYSCNAFA
jgi:hypothetical protein